MSIDRKSPDRFHRETTANSGLKGQAEFILANLKHFHNSWNPRTGERGKQTLIKKAETITEIFKKLSRNEWIEDWERKAVDEAYELVMRGYGLDSVPVHRDKRRKGLRFG